VWVALLEGREGRETSFAAVDILLQVAEVVEMLGDLRQQSGFLI
jgi:hypothetical protein